MLVSDRGRGNTAVDGGVTWRLRPNIQLDAFAGAGLSFLPKPGTWMEIFKKSTGFLLFLIAIIAESNRAPFDLPETENELVSGFMTEYGGIKFALYFMGEYTAMLVNSSVTTETITTMAPGT